MLRKNSVLKQCYNVFKTQYYYMSKNANSPMYVFDRTVKKLQKERAIIHPESKLADYLKEEVGSRIYDNLIDIKRTYKKIVDLNCGRGYVSKYIDPDMTDELILCDSSPLILDQCEEPKGVKCTKLIVDEENLPFEPNSIDVFLSCLSLHWVNDLPGALSQILKCLKNDGVLIGSLFGAGTLYEMRSSLQLAELERDGGISLHVSPFAAVRDIGSLLTLAGYTLLTIDTDELQVGYPSMFELMWDLQAMGENNAAINRCSHLSRDTLLAAAAIYENMYGDSEKIPATFQLINLIAWKPDPSQPKPIPRGSAEYSMKDLNKLDEIIKEKGFINLNEKEKK